MCYGYTMNIRYEAVTAPAIKHDDTLTDNGRTGRVFAIKSLPSGATAFTCANMAGNMFTVVLRDDQTATRLTF